MSNFAWVCYFCLGGGEEAWAMRDCIDLNKDLLKSYLHCLCIWNHLPGRLKNDLCCLLMRSSLSPLCVFEELWTDSLPLQICPLDIGKYIMIKSGPGLMVLSDHWFSCVCFVLFFTCKGTAGWWWCRTQVLDYAGKLSPPSPTSHLTPGVVPCKPIEECWFHFTGVWQWNLN